MSIQNNQIIYLNKNTIDFDKRLYVLNIKKSKSSGSQTACRVAMK